MREVGGMLNSRGAVPRFDSVTLDSARAEAHHAAQILKQQLNVIVREGRGDSRALLPARSDCVMKAGSTTAIGTLINKDSVNDAETAPPATTTKHKHKHKHMLM